MRIKDSGKREGLSYMDGSERIKTISEDWDVIDQVLWDIMNADTNLRSVMNTDPNLAGKIQTTFDYYNPSAGVFTSWVTRLRGEGRSKLLEVLNKEQQLLIEQAAMLEKQVMEGAKRQAEFKLFLAQHVMTLLEIKAKAKLNEQAFGKGMFVEHYSDVNKEEELRKIRQREYAARTGIDEMREEERLKRKLKEEEERQRREQEAEEARIKRNLDAARAYKMNEDTITDDLRKKMEKALLELDEIEERTDISERTRASLKISKENEVENLRRRIEARERKAASDEESYL